VYGTTRGRTATNIYSTDTQTTQRNGAGGSNIIKETNLSSCSHIACNELKENANVKFQHIQTKFFYSTQDISDAINYIIIHTTKYIEYHFALLFAFFLTGFLQCECECSLFSECAFS